MAHVAFFKFPDTAIDTVPADLIGDTDAATLKTLLKDLYTDNPTAVDQGKFVFGNTADGVNAPVFQVIAKLIQYDGVGSGSDNVLFQLRDASALLRVMP